ncbi:hypothetical protein [Nocardioides sp.]|uniref:hypothetical protein n=1 Tax=Nocardioides sp. TaxID=35761 RepID=UPI00351268AE
MSPSVHPTTASTAISTTTTIEENPMSRPSVRRALATRLTAVTVGTAALAAPLVLLSSPAAHADVERGGVCGVGTYDFSVDREGRGFEIGVDLDFVPAGSTWRVQVFHEGKRVVNTVRRADREGDLEVDAYRANTAGKDTFRFRATRVGGASCGATITVR